MSDTITVMEPATSRQLDRHVAVLRNLAAKHGLSNLRHSTRPGTLVADVDRGRTYFDLARFEVEAEAILRATVYVLPAGAPAAAELVRGPLGVSAAA